MSERRWQPWVDQNEADAELERLMAQQPPGPFDWGWIFECARHYDSAGEELFNLPWWAWLRRRRAAGWRKHYAEKIADEFEAWRINTMERI